ncbi:unnamed protein product [marine sediment metagenome]|uniref:MrpA C-terminal/MbhE domain-containing protein n=1 Tax=marine sediment metagenome TaxID=412755 RepID=X0XYC3_9ZZZZ
MNASVKALFLALLLVFLFAAAIRLRDFGVPQDLEMDEYFISNAQQETASNNVVTSIVFDYRGLDTLGEATVLFTAAAGVVLLFREAIK